MTFSIPLRDMPVDAVKVTDPVTGATYMVPRQVKREDPDVYLQGCLKPATCRTPFCKKAGLRHDKCIGQGLYNPYCHCAIAPYPLHHGRGYASDPFDPAYSDSDESTEHASPFVPPRPSPSPPPPPQPSAEENAFQRWLQSFPHWRMPRECPPDWRPSSLPEGRYNPYRASYDLSQQGTPYPPYASPWGYPQSVYGPTPWPNIAGLPNQVPDRVEWNNVQGGRLQWTPHPWVPHPLPHPEMPAQAFWNYPGQPNALHSWVGPGGWSPHYELDRDRMNSITGGHPLPGMDPYWTPTQWVPPPYNPRYGVSLSPWLAPNPRNGAVPFVLWDVAVEPPYMIRRLTSRGNIVDFATSDFFKEPATIPAVRTLQVNLPHMRSSWGPVVINKDSQIRVGDIFNAVWEYLQKQLTWEDWQALRNTYGEERCRRIRYAMERRCLTAGGLFEHVKSQGLKRVDLLQNSTVYWGTHLTYNADWTWSLTMGFISGTRTAN